LGERGKVAEAMAVVERFVRGGATSLEQAAMI
jgi:hypothetical protein